MNPQLSSPLENETVLPLKDEELGMKVVVNFPKEFTSCDNQDGLVSTQMAIVDHATNTVTPLDTTPVVNNARKFMLISRNKPLPEVTPLTKRQRAMTGQIVPLDMEQIMKESEAIGEKYFNALRSTHSEKFD